MTAPERRKYVRAISAAASALGRAPDGLDDEVDSLIANAATALEMASQRLQKLAQEKAK